MPSRLSSPLLHMSSHSSIFASNLNCTRNLKKFQRAKEYYANYMYINSNQATTDLDNIDLSVPPQENINAQLPQLPKKRVSFADSVGLELAEIRHITAGRDTPPNLDPEIFATLNLSEDKRSKSMPTFTLDFLQPVSDYNQFRQSLEQNNVSLESVSINDNLLIGTVKVKNLAFHKTVVLRITYDNWVNAENVSAYYVNNGLVNGHGTEITSCIDTFSFIHEIPTERLKQNIQFAICFRCEGQEFWDNHGGCNYHIKVKKNGECLTESKHTSTSCQLPSETNWTEFAIWRSLESDYTPYW